MPASFGLTSGQSSNITSLALTPGIYIINYQVSIIISGTTTYSGASVYVNNTSTPDGIGTNTVSVINNNYNLTSGGYNPLYLSNSTNLIVTSSTTYYLNLFALFSANSQFFQTRSFFNAMRIA